MRIFSLLFYPWSMLLQVLAIIHFIRRRPESYWLYIIVFLGPLGAVIYLLAVALPDLGAAGQTLRGVPRRKRIDQLEALVLENPSAGNFEELGELYMDQGNLALARCAFDKAIGSRSDAQDCYYRRGLCALRAGDAEAAVPDLEHVVGKEFDYDFHRAAGELARSYASTGKKAEAEALFRKVTGASTLSETYLNFADFLASEGRTAEAREWAQKVLDKQRAMPEYMRRRERPSFRRANDVLKRLAV